MTTPAPTHVLHGIGLGLSVALIGLAALLWFVGLPWLDGTWAGDLATIVFVVAATGLLQAGELAWAWGISRFMR